MNRTPTRLIPRPLPPGVRRDLGTVATLLAVAALAAVVSLFLRGPDRVDRVAVENPHPWYVSVNVRGGDDDGWLPVGAVERESSQSYRDVIDQGPTWTFRFAYAGHTADLHVTRDQLAEDGWQVTVPRELAEELSGDRVATTPR
ncbi:MAG TPA: hypothetical protein VIL48_09920 [Acidimicrobiales bacterium]